ncbi:unnamed protein product, partial [Amoebophrya sp. A25]|eukprot:GSA25T00010815001.1
MPLVVVAVCVWCSINIMLNYIQNSMKNMMSPGLQVSLIRYPFFVAVCFLEGAIL